jgi:hypothetical protein
MTATVIDMTEDEFDAAYTLRPNHLNPNASWAIGDGPGCLFEISLEEIKFVRRQNPRTIWTLLDGDDGNLHLVSGYHLVNRVGYLITTIPVPQDVLIRVCIPMSQDIEEHPSAAKSFELAGMPAQIRDALELVLEHFYLDEAGDYERCGSDDPNHIFHPLHLLWCWITNHAQNSRNERSAAIQAATDAVRKQPKKPDSRSSNSEGILS